MSNLMGISESQMVTIENKYPGFKAILESFSVANDGIALTKSDGYDMIKYARQALGYAVFVDIELAILRIEEFIDVATGQPYSSTPASDITVKQTARLVAHYLQILAEQKTNIPYSNSTAINAYIHDDRFRTKNLITAAAFGALAIGAVVYEVKEHSKKSSNRRKRK